MTGSVMTSSEMGQRKSSGHDACSGTSSMAAAFLAWGRRFAAGDGGGTESVWDCGRRRGGGGGGRPYWGKSTSGGRKRDDVGESGETVR